MLDYRNFYEAISNIKKFMIEQGKLYAILRVICPSSQNVCEFGNEFLYDYIKLLEKAVNDQSNWVSWFIFENDFGEKGLKIELSNKKKYKITSEKLLYDICLKNPL